MQACHLGSSTDEMYFHGYATLSYTTCHDERNHFYHSECFGVDFELTK